MFKFPLQRLLELKAKREQELARQLAVARGEAQRESEARDALRALQSDSAADLARRTGTSASVGELLSLGYTVTQLGAQVDAAETRANEAEAVAERSSAALTGAVQDRQVLDRLRERRLDEHRAAEQHVERTTMDAIALGQFTARRTPNDSPSSGGRGSIP